MGIKSKKTFKIFKKVMIWGLLFLIVLKATLMHNNYLLEKEQVLKNIEVDLEGISTSLIEDITEEDFYNLVKTSQIVKAIRLAKADDKNLVIKTVDNRFYSLPYEEEYENTLLLLGVIENDTLILKDTLHPITVITNILIVISLFLILFVLKKEFSKPLFEMDLPMMPMFEIGGGNIKPPVEEPVEEPFIMIKKLTFNDVQGIDELKPDLYRLVDCLKQPEKYTNLGARLPKGVILYGPPGTGKTLIAKALAGEAGVPFFSASGSDFVEKYVGVGASRIRDLYNRARKSRPCIVFIDEIDAIGSNRGDGLNGEKDQTVNALLTELDGFKSMEGILTICATNRLDILDSALIRAGRFDLKLAIELPDKKSRLQILKLHSKDKKLSMEVDIEALAKKTIGFSGAELENLLNESALIAATLNKKAIDNKDLEEAFFKIIMDGNKKKRDEEDTSAKLVAYHEAGHTLATKLLTKDSVPTVTIIQSTSGAGGVTFTAPEEQGLKSKKYLKNQIKVSYAGRAAEEILLGNDEDITTGASQDIKDATNIIRNYISNYGMGTKGMLDIKQLTVNYDIVREASELATLLYKETLDLLIENKDKLERLALSLLDKETLDESEIDKLIKE